VIAADTARYPRSPLGKEQSAWSRERPVSAEQMIAAMDEAGVARTVLVQASTCYGHDNSYVAAAVAAHPDRFLGVFSVDVLAPGAPDRIRDWTGRKLRGMRVFVAGHTARTDARLDDPAAYPAWKYASDAGIPICVQIRAGGVAQLDAMLVRFPEARVLLDHMARPAIADGPPYVDAAPLFALARHRNLHLKLTTHNVRESRQGKATPETFFARVVKEFGASRIAWGSNYPASEGTLASLLADARAALASLPQEYQDWIFFRTAKAFYPTLADRHART
jgi:predicted TIM-barrel fold metal-dependent hydrolase